MTRQERKEAEKSLQETNKQGRVVKKALEKRQMRNWRKRKNENKKEKRG